MINTEFETDGYRNQWGVCIGIYVFVQCEHYHTILCKSFLLLSVLVSWSVNAPLKWLTSIWGFLVPYDLKIHKMVLALLENVFDATMLLFRDDASKGMESLDLTWVSRANALQRKGRATRRTCSRRRLFPPFHKQSIRLSVQGTANTRYKFCFQMRRSWNNLQQCRWLSDVTTQELILHYFYCRNTKGSSWTDSTTD